MIWPVLASFAVTAFFCRQFYLLGREHERTDCREVNDWRGGFLAGAEAQRKLTLAASTPPSTENN